MICVTTEDKRGGCWTKPDDLETFATMRRNICARQSSISGAVTPIFVRLTHFFRDAVHIMLSAFVISSDGAHFCLKLGSIIGVTQQIYVMTYQIFVELKPIVFDVA